MESKTNIKAITQNDKGEYTIYIEGVGEISETGKLDVEGLLESLLKSKYITG